MNVDIELTVNNGNHCGEEELYGKVFEEIKEVTGDKETTAAHRLRL